MHLPPLWLTSKEKTLCLASIAMLLVSISFVENLIILYQNNINNLRAEEELNGFVLPGIGAESEIARENQREKMRKMAVDEIEETRKSRERPLGVMPRGFSIEAAVISFVYLLAMSLFLVRRAEQSRDDWKSRPPTQWKFVSYWTGVGFLPILGTTAILLACMRSLSLNEGASSLSVAIYGLLWVQVVHAMLGVVVLRGRRWAAFILGTILVLIMLILTLACSLLLAVASGAFRGMT